MLIKAIMDVFRHTAKVNTSLALKYGLNKDRITIRDKEYIVSACQADGGKAFVCGYILGCNKAREDILSLGDDGKFKDKVPEECEKLVAGVVAKELDRIAKHEKP